MQRKSLISAWSSTALLLALTALWHLDVVLSVEASQEQGGNGPVRDFIRSLWTERGIAMPSQGIFSMVEKAMFQPEVAPGRSPLGNLVLVSMTEVYGMDKTLPIFAESLRNITFTTRNGSHSNLARHLIVSLMSPMAKQKCETMATLYGFHCFSMFARDYSAITPNASDFGLKYKSLEFYAAGFVRIKLILDILSMGTNVLFLDTDQVFFQNPVAYVAEREADVIVAAEFCHLHSDTQPNFTFPSPQNIGFLFMRPTPLTIRAVTNWFTMMTDIANRGGKAWDQGTFTYAIQEVATAFGPDRLRLLLASSPMFPTKCMGDCGCDLAGASEASKWVGQRVEYQAGGQKRCTRESMQPWVSYHFACSGVLRDKAMLMGHYAAMYDELVRRGAQ